MLKKLLDKLQGRASRTEPFSPHMPEVDVGPNLADIFDQARKAAAGELEQPSGRHVVIVTPGRMIAFQPCPAPGSMPPAQVQNIEAMIPAQVKRKIAAIAYNGVDAITTDLSQAIPFLGFLVAFAYIGHSVWVFEGHESALVAGCKDADVLIVDGGMIPHLHKDWATVVSGVMRNREIYVHDRTTYALRRFT